MVRLSPRAFSGSKDVKVLLPAISRRRRQAEFVGQAVLELGARATASDQYPVAECAKQVETPAPTARPTGKPNPETAQI